jgi:hypothetical protein
MKGALEAGTPYKPSYKYKNMNSTAVVSVSPRISWRAILAGAIVALSIHLLLTSLGAGITALAARPSATESPARAVALGLALSWTLSALISLWFGGWVAGKIASPGDRDEGALHGFVMWSTATVVAFMLLAAGVGKTLSLAGQTAAGSAKAVAAAVPELAKKSAEVIDQYSAEVAPAAGPMSPAGKREVALALKNYLAGGDAGRTPQNREALITAVTKNTSMAPADAGKTVDEWTASYDRAKAEVTAQVDDAAAKAKEIADKTAAATGAGAIWTFIAFWIGALASVWGGRCGAAGCHPFGKAKA